MTRITILRMEFIEMNESHNYDLCKIQFDFNIIIFFFSNEER